MEATQEDTVKVLDEMTASVSAAREVIKELITRYVACCHTRISRSCIVHRNENSELDSKDGISLLSMKCHLMLSYLHSLTLLGAHRVLGHSLGERNPPTSNFSEANRQKRGSNAGDLVDALVQDRLVLEKVKGLEGRMKYQIDKLLRMADEEARTGTIREDGTSNSHSQLYNFVSHLHKIHWHSAPIPGISRTTLIQ